MPSTRMIAYLTGSDVAGMVMTRILTVELCVALTIAPLLQITSLYLGVIFTVRTRVCDRPFSYIMYSTVQ